MTSYLIRRLLFSVPLLLGIATLTFIVVHLAPGDPMDMFLNPHRLRQHSPEVIEQIREKYGLDRPLYWQYARWLSHLCQGDLGESFRYRRPVTRLIAERIPYTLLLSLPALLFEALVGISLGIYSAVRQYSLADKVVTLGSLVIHSIPGFWMALMLVLLFSIKLRWLPTSQARSLDYDLMNSSGKAFDLIRHLILPVFVLAIGSAAGTARYMRNRLLEVLSNDYVVAARARGLSERAVILRHATRNALIPIITIYGMSLPLLLGGAVLIENIFAWPGIGSLAVEAVNGRDYPVIMATTMMSAVLVVAGNLLADVLYGLADPRVSYARAKVR